MNGNKTENICVWPYLRTAKSSGKLCRRPELQERSRQENARQISVSAELRK
jgi:hypothetical protein